MAAPEVVDHWWPVTHDFGLVQAPLEDAVTALMAVYDRHEHNLHVERLEAPLSALFGRLLPLQFAYTRRLFVATDFGWTAYFTNGGAGSDPFPAMSLLAREMDILAMRVCSTPAQMYHQATIWEVYGGLSHTDHKLGYLRSIAVCRTDGRWSHEETGAPFAFEDTAAGAARRKRDRFNPALLAGYLAHWGIPALTDARLESAGAACAVLLAAPTHAHLPTRTLDEAKARLLG